MNLQTLGEVCDFSIQNNGQMLVIQPKHLRTNPDGSMTFLDTQYGSLLMLAKDCNWGHLPCHPMCIISTTLITMHFLTPDPLPHIKVQIVAHHALQRGIHHSCFTQPPDLLAIGPLLPKDGNLKKNHLFLLFWHHHTIYRRR